jgi:putative transposase
MMLKGYKYRIYPKPRQAELLEKHFGCVRFIYNWALDMKNRSYAQTGRSPGVYQLANEIPKMKMDLPWLAEVNSQSLQRSLLNLDNAFTNFFRKIREHDRDPGYPTFKRKRGRLSFQCPQHVKVDFDGNCISIPKIPKIKTVFSRRFMGKIKTVTISKNPSGKYFVSILVEDGKSIPERKPIDRSKAVGIDLGIKHFCVLSNGKKVGNPRFGKGVENRIARLNRRVSRKIKGSNNRARARIRLARKYETITNRRRDFLHKLSSRLVDENQTICIEDLNVRGMAANHSLAGSIMDAAWGEFAAMLEYKSGWRGGNLIFIGRFDPSSRMCSKCGHIHGGLTLRMRSWTCERCGAEHDRDVNAAVNIRNFALNRQNMIRQVPLDERESTLGETEPLPGCRTAGQVPSLNQESAGL